jgi:predicted nuclease with RNAse H fold
MQIVGIDCASKSEKTGIAIGKYVNNSLSILYVGMGNKKQSITAHILSKIDLTEQTLFAIDAPLGWTAPMGNLLANHFAGEPIAEDQDRFFRRMTDTFVHQRIGKLPLEVGADRIARTAHSALKIIGELRERGLPLQMLWDWGLFTNKNIKYGVIEVYPSATLKQMGFISSGYKGDSTEEKQKRQQIIHSLAKFLPSIVQFPHLEDNADMLDATICLLCAQDFLEGKAIAPSDLAMARKEGWIWVRNSE